jgi:iron(II)-dependent oxidoreductase
VVGVTWYESLAFCRWLSEAWQKDGWLASSESITLPSEAEWEKAARGGLEIPAKVLVNAAGSRGSEQIQRHANPLPKRPFPWGNEEPEANLANYEKNIGSTTAVGCYPGNTSPYGCLDLAGNVWEWTRSLDHGYPYDPGDGREDLEKVKSNSVVQLRGGAWYHGATSLRCAARDRYGPIGRGHNLGFRVVVRPHFSQTDDL